MPTSRNARGIDLLIYDTIGHYHGIQIKTLSKYGAVPLGTKGLDDLLGDWWIIVTGAATDPQCFIIKPDEVRERAVRDEDGARAYWLPAKQYHTNEFREAWNRIGHGSLQAESPGASARQ
jgi:hypothetical protein